MTDGEYKETLRLVETIIADFERKSWGFLMYSTALIAAACAIRADNGMSNEEISDSLHRYADITSKGPSGRHEE